MKTLKTIAIKCATMLASVSLALAVMTSNSTCYVFSYQPSPPKGLSKYINSKR